MREILQALAAERDRLHALLMGLAAPSWELATPAPGWNVRDQIAHLADTDEVARDTIASGPRDFRTAVGGFASAEEFTEAGRRRGDGLPPAELLAWRSRASSALLEAFSCAAPEVRVRWGFGMSLTDFARARLMEHWAHGLDIHDTLGPAPPGPARTLRFIAELGLATVPYALIRARVPRPPGRSLRLDLSSPAGEVRLGPKDATDAITGPLDAWCRVAVRRDRTGERGRLTASGPLAELALTHARAYL